MTRKDDAWKEEFVADTFLRSVRGGIPFAREQAEVMLRLASGLAIPVRSFMDLGCGGGALAGAILDNIPGASGTLVDFSGPMLREARSRFGAREDVRIIEADFGRASWVDAVKGPLPFDLIVSGFAIHHQPDREKKRIYGEVFSLLRPGGLFVNIEHVASRSEWGKALADGLFIDSVLEYNRARGKGGTREEVINEFFNRPDKDSNLLAPVEYQCEWLREAGFSDVDCFFKAFEMAVFGGRKPGAGR
ncbi:MAG: class I SAM-dependent methyltransferase [Thermodesulfobacteriota bacterium]